MILLTVEEIISLHKKLVLKTGGSDGLRDRGLLESAVYSAYGSFGDEEAYPTIEEKSARLAFSLISNHSFVDGNKRIGIVVMLVTLRLNKVNLEYTQEELVRLGLAIADSSADYNEILDWIKKHKI